MQRLKESFSSVRIKFLDKNKVLRELEEISSWLKKIRPEVVAVILFGSLAKGNYTGGSDADVLVIVKDSHKDFVERIFEFRKYFLKCSLPVDVLVYTEEEIKDMQEKGGFINLAIKEGVSLG